MTHTFEIRDTFYLDEKPYQIISGAVHYFRILPEYWKDRLEKLKACGCNTVETYIPWNVHEPKKGQFNFSGLADIVRFVRTAEELGLYVILRPSPYICAEWEFGGLPGWLLKEDGIRLRTAEGSYFQHVTDYYKTLLPLITPLQVTENGPVILMQVENEYGYYGEDTEYLEAMKKLMTDLGVTVPLVTSDGPFPESMACGHLPGVLPTGNFGSRTEERFAVLKNYTQGDPLMCTEFWVGWFDHWGNGGHMRGNLEESTKDLDRMLDLGHVNIYMFEGGTNFGFMNGSNYYDTLTPDVTSYDYDAVLSEDGQITEKYRRYAEVIARHTKKPAVIPEPNIPRASYGTLKADASAGLFASLSALSEKHVSKFPVCMEKLDQNYGYILYRTKLEREQSLEKIRLYEANDRANLYLDGTPFLTLYDTELLREHEVDTKAIFKNGAELSILMENMGRVNFGPRMEHQRKGIDGHVQINGHTHLNWEEYPLPLDHPEDIPWGVEKKEGQPAFYHFTFNAKETADTFLDLAGWGKGCAFVNGFNIGRFWEIGPQKRLYIPAPLLKQGENEIIIFETDGKQPGTIILQDEPDIG